MLLAAHTFYFQWEFSFLDRLWSLHTPFLDALMCAVTKLGNGGVFWILLAVLLLCIKKYRPCGLAVACALLCSVTFGNGIIKNVVQRARPCWINEAIQPLLLVANPTDFSFPSGHSMASFAAATALLLTNRKMGIAATVLAACIAFTRLYLYVHWPTDVLCGILLGIVWGLMGYAIAKRFLSLIASRKEHTSP